MESSKCSTTMKTRTNVADTNHYRPVLRYPRYRCSCSYTIIPRLLTAVLVGSLLFCRLSIWLCLHPSHAVDWRAHFKRNWYGPHQIDAATMCDLHGSGNPQSWKRHRAHELEGSSNSLLTVANVPLTHARSRSAHCMLSPSSLLHALLPALLRSQPIALARRTTPRHSLHASPTTLD
jgi:hypothetical protein